MRVASAICLFCVVLVAEPAVAQQTSATSAPSAAAQGACPFLRGPRFGSFGPNSVVTVAGVVQPSVCWLELSLGLGFDTGAVEAFDEWRDDADALDFSGDGRYFAFTVPFGARVWFMNGHSLLADAGVGFTRYLMSADVEYYGETGQTWSRLSTTLVAYAGAGYGYRVNGAQAGPRLALILGALVHLTELSGSAVDGNDPWSSDQLAGLKDALDDESDELTDLEPYAEVSVSWIY
jgi:hypothetical protein